MKVLFLLMVVGIKPRASQVFGNLYTINLYSKNRVFSENLYLTRTVRMLQ